jgi:hypothetical protein
MLRKGVVRMSCFHRTLLALLSQRQRQRGQPVDRRGCSAKGSCLQANQRVGAIAPACNNLRNNTPGLPQY